VDGGLHVLQDATDMQTAPSLIHRADGIVAASLEPGLLQRSIDVDAWLLLRV